jgi:hypothetical protein
MFSKTWSGIAGFSRAAFWARNFNENLGPIGLDGTRKSAFCHVCDKAAKRWSLVPALFLSGCLSVHNPLVTHLNAQQPMLNLVFLGDSLTERVPQFDAVADPAPQLTNPADTTLFWDGCHLFPKGYQIVANLAAAAIRSIPQ